MNIRILSAFFAGAMLGVLAGYSIARPTAEQVASQSYSHLAINYWNLVSPDSGVLSSEEVFAKSRASLAVQFINMAPLYKELADESYKKGLVDIATSIVDHRMFDDIREADLRDHGYEAANCIVSLENQSDDPVPCLETYARGLLG